MGISLTSLIETNPSPVRNLKVNLLGDVTGSANVDLVSTIDNFNEANLHIESTVNGYQPTLESTVNIKTIAGETILGSGNLPLKTINGNKLIGTGDIIIDSGGGEVDLSGYQEKLVCGTNLKTINGTCLLGSGDLPLKTINGNNITGSGDISIYESPFIAMGIYYVVGKITSNSNADKITVDNSNKFGNPIVFSNNTGKKVWCVIIVTGRTHILNYQELNPLLDKRNLAMYIDTKYIDETGPIMLIGEYIAYSYGLVFDSGVHYIEFRANKTNPDLDVNVGLGVSLFTQFA